MLADDMQSGGEGLTSFALSVYKHYRDQLRRYLARRMPQSQDVDDVAQEVYLRLLRVDSDAAMQEPLKYLYVVAAHTLADHMAVQRRDSQRHVFTDELPENLESNASAAHQGQPEEITRIDQEVMKALAGLPEMHAAVLYLFERDGLTRREIAVKCRIKEDTVKTYLTQARRMLRAMVWPPQDIPARDL